MVCFNFGETDHISTQFQKPKKTQDVKVVGKVFALSGVKASKFDNLVRGTCFINDIPIITIIDTGATHSFIFVECVKILCLVVSAMNDIMVIDTPTNGLVTTFLVFLNCPLTIYGSDFSIHLVCLPFSQLDIILGMNWFSSTYLYQLL